MKKTTPHFAHRGRDAFTMVEVLIASAISVMVLACVIGFFVSIFTYWHGINLRIEADQQVNLTMSWMIYGEKDNEDRWIFPGLRSAAATSIQLDATPNGSWTLQYRTSENPPRNYSFIYSATDETITAPSESGRRIIGRNISMATVTPEPLGLALRLRVNLATSNGRVQARREIDTRIFFRN